MCLQIGIRPRYLAMVAPVVHAVEDDWCLGQCRSMVVFLGTAVLASAYDFGYGHGEGDEEMENNGK